MVDEMIKNGKNDLKGVDDIEPEEKENKKGKHKKK